MRALDWDSVRYFLALADAGSLSAAARRLRVEHTTVARRVDALEAALGVRLFDRLPRAWQLTVEGEALVPHARRIEDEALGFQRAAAGSAPLAGMVRLSVPPAVATHLLVPHLATLRRAQPGIVLELVAESREANLSHREADIALRLNRPDAPGLALRALDRLGYGLYAQAAYLDATDPADWVFAGYDDSLRGAPQQQWLEKIAGTRRWSFRANDLGMLVQALASGLGVGVLPHFMARGVPELRAIAEPACPVERTLWLVMHEDVRRSPRVRAVANAVAALFAPGGPLAGRSS